jgi:anaerobic selenocysteine-containing dehydrogenase
LGILQGLSDGSVRAVVLLGADPIGDFPDLGLATGGLQAAEFVLAVDTLNSHSLQHAHLVLPAAMHHEKPGTTTNIEGRVLRVGQKLTPPVLCWPDWMIAVELAARLGADLGVGSAEELWDEIARLAPSHAGLTGAMLNSPGARDGVVVPMKAEQVVLVRRTGSGGGGRGGAADPMATPGIESVEVQGPISRVGEAEPQGSIEQQNGHVAIQPPHSGGVSTKRPALLAFSKSAARGAGAAGGAAGAGAHVRAEGSLTLVSPRRLYDHGVQMLESEFLAGMVDKLVARVNPAELQSRQIASGSTARLGSNGTALELEVVADPGVLVGVVEVSANIRPSRGDDRCAAKLTNAEEVITDLKLEPA